ncbi:response regulator transcription factor [Nitrosophilus alvini]|uniref:response regulator transcription factor n=1 Tax=Nitrosophilus alvini TaxID=2714855 RepID=UPI0019094C16|nr:response regulator transcription factor [Nitrosophilus alvini]
MKILLLEDDHLLRKHISKYLELKGHKVDSFADGEELLENANLYDYDFFILDINVPNFSGFDILEYIKGKHLDTPVIFISALVGIDDIKKAFKLGCSDYLKKPFELAELEIRMENILSKFHRENRIKFADNLEYDFDNKILYKNGKEIILSKKQNDIMNILLKNRGKVVPFETIADYVWGDTSIDYRTISSHLRDIRKQIGSDVVKNVRGVGYIIK